MRVRVTDPMPSRPLRFEFLGTPQLPAAEAAARRRLRGMEAQHPAATAWTVRIEAAETGSAAAPRFHATAQAVIGGGGSLRGSGRADDVLAALRLAFNALEAELDEEHEQARTRVALWLAAVRRRLDQRPGFGH